MYAASFDPFGKKPDGTKDEPYTEKDRWVDLPAFTWAIYSIGYRPYLLVREDNGHRQTVWAKSVEDVKRYAPGEVTPIEPVTQVSQYSVIVLDEQDGGGANVNGTRAT